MHFYLELYIKILLLSSVFWQLIWYFHHQRRVNCTHKYICFGCYSDCVFSVFLHGIIEAFLSKFIHYIYKMTRKPKSVILNSRVTALGLFDFIYSAHYCIWTLHFVGHEWVFHGHILRQCWSLWWRLPVLCNPAPYFSDCPVFCTLVSNVVTLLSDCKSMLYIVNCS